MSLVVRACALACALVVLAGCQARQSQEQYEERLGAVALVRAEVVEGLERGKYADAEAYERASERVSAAIEQLDVDPPPRALRTAHDRMIGGMGGLAILLDRLARCEERAEASQQDRRACRQSIGQEAYDAIRNDFEEANTIYREEGVPIDGDEGAGGGGFGGDGGGDSLDEDPEGGDAL